MLFARAEALHAHGYVRHAVRLAVHLSEEMLENPPNLLAPPPPNLASLTSSSSSSSSGANNVVDLQSAGSLTPPVTTKSGKKKSKAAAAAAAAQAAANTSQYASVVMTRLAFLSTVLLEDVVYHNLAFRVSAFGLEMPRLPASTKPLEVKLFNQESELAALLRKIPLGAKELTIIKEKAEWLRDGLLTTRGDTLLPLTLAHFIFDALCVPNNCTHAVDPAITAISAKNIQNSIHAYRTPADELLGFEATVTTLGLKANVSEADHPLLCEGTRRMRGELALALLVHYKDDQNKLNRIMEKLLDKEVHHLQKNSLLVGSSTIRSATSSSLSASKASSTGSYTPTTPIALPKQTTSTSPFVQTLVDKSGPDFCRFVLCLSAYLSASVSL